MAITRVFTRAIGSIFGLATLTVLGFIGYATFYATKTIHELLTENRQLREAITNLTREDQIGFAKVIEQGEREGRLYTRLRFVETDRNDPTKRLLERECEVEGDLVFFDALIVKFGDQVVLDGKEKALYLWTRVYGEKMAPADGFPLELEGQSPARYADLDKRLPLDHRRTFWTEIWSLAQDPQRLAEISVKAVYGNALSVRMRPGLIYIFKISPTGTFYPETVPDL